MDTENFKELINRYITGTLQEGDKATLRRLLNDPKYVQELERLMDEQLAAKAPAEYEYPEAVNRIKLAIEENIHTEEATGTAHRIPLYSRKWARIAVAAAILLLIGSTALIRFMLNKKPAPVPAVVTQAAVSVAPGSNKALLTLANGSTITLDSSARQVIQQGQTTIRQYGGQLQYTAGNTTATASYNILRTPAGGQYQLTLPDGSKVWLNASSSLRFPTAFNGSERNVELTGEAYFEVAKHAGMPFKVVANDVTIEILGTHFNVNAYADEQRIATTLLEGAVKVNNGDQAVVLKPGQQAVYSRATHDLRSGAADTEGAVAWKNGYFKFSNENIRSVMRKIARWYDVDIEYRGDVSDKALWGTISRFENIPEVLDMLEMTGTMHFRMEGRKVIVMP
jgi:ferric-dicitrate binding protein FerR (iron transport regulator)